MIKPYIPDIIPETDRKMFERSSMGGESTPGTNPAILVVDMTRGFVEEPFPLASPTKGAQVTERIFSLLEVARPKGIPVFFSRGFPRENLIEDGAWGYKRLSLGVNPIGGPMNTEEAHAIVGKLTPQPGEITVTKAKPSMFFGTQLVSMLVYKNIDTLIITGMVTSGCVRATVVDAFSYNYRVIVPVECVGDRGEISHQISLFDIGQKYGNVWPVDQVISYLNELSSTMGG